MSPFLHDSIPTPGDPLQWQLRLPGGWELLGHKGSSLKEAAFQNQPSEPAASFGADLRSPAALPSSLFFFFFNCYILGTLLPEAFLVYLFYFLDFVKLKIYQLSRG